MTLQCILLIIIAFLVGVGVDTGVQVDFNQLRHLMFIFIAARFHQIRGNLLGVDFFKDGDVAHFRGNRITDPEAFEDGD